MNKIEQRYTLTITLPLDENYEKVAKYLLAFSYQKIFWHSFMPPHKLEYIIGPLSESGVLKVKGDFRQMFEDSKFKSYCNFRTEIFKDDL